MVATFTAAGRRALLAALRAAVGDARNLIVETLRDYRVTVNEADVVVVEHTRCGEIIAPPDDSPWLGRIVKLCVDHALSCPEQD